MRPNRFVACQLALTCLAMPVAALAQSPTQPTKVRSSQAALASPAGAESNFALPDTDFPEFEQQLGRNPRPHVLLANYSYTMAWPIQDDSVFSGMPLVGGTVLIDVRILPTRRDDEDRWAWKDHGDRAITSLSLYLGWQVEYGVNSLDGGARATLLMHSARAGALVNFDVTDGFRLFLRGGIAMPYMDLRYAQESDPEFGESNIQEWRQQGWARPCGEVSGGFAPSVSTRELVFPRIGLAFEGFSKICMDPTIDDSESAPVADEQISVWTVGGAVSFVAAF